MLTNRLAEAEKPHWTEHAEHYLALVRAAVENDPRDEELHELLLAMEAAVAVKRRRISH
jgi:hypothetical protein